MKKSLFNKDYPYMSARVSAKRAKLLDRRDYDNLLKMEPNEIARNLEEGEYKEDIDALGSRYDGVRLVELALSRNLARTLSEIVDLSPEDLQNVINIYLRRYDIISFKRLLRWKQGNSQNGIQDFLTPVTSFDYAELKELSEKPFEEIVTSIRFDSEVDYQSYLDGAEELSAVERALDQAYFDELEILANNVRSTHFKEFIKDEMEYENLRTALRLKKHGIEKQEIRDRLLKNGGSSLVDSVIEAASYEDAFNRVVEERLDEEVENLEELEHALEVDRLQNALKMLHTEPLGLTTIIGYLIAKIIEVKNLRMLIRAKETGIHNMDTIRKNLVIAE